MRDFTDLSTDQIAQAIKERQEKEQVLLETKDRTMLYLHKPVHITSKAYLFADGVGSLALPKSLCIFVNIHDNGFEAFVADWWIDKHLRELHSIRSEFGGIFQTNQPICLWQLDRRLSEMGIKDSTRITNKLIL